MPGLKESAPEKPWRIVPPDESSWWDLELRTPLEHLLIEANPQQWLQEFVRSALVDLRDAGLVEHVRRVVGT